MSEEYVFQIEEWSSLDEFSIQVEGRCCEGTIQAGDKFSELVIRGKSDEGSFYEKQSRSVSANVCEVISIRPGVLGLSEAGTLTLEGLDREAIARDCLLKGNRS
jgi:hypothetical protein